jgi:hypothetical protein
MSLSNFKPDQSSSFAVPTNEIVNLGSSGGNGNRSFLYASYRKEPRVRSEQNSLQCSKLDFKKAQADYVNKWNHFDSNMNNAIVE